VLAQVLRSTYSDLFSTFPDAHRRDNEVLRNFFSTHTTGGEQVLSLITRTFRTLADLADLEAETPQSAEAQQPALTTEPVTTRQVEVQAGPRGVTININVQVSVPETTNTDVYDSFFAAMKRHLFPDT
jgi:Family of unknown function (DUF5343)